MSTQIPVPAPEENPEMRKRAHFPWAGVVLITLGVVFLLRVFNINLLQNWWALFILIPAFGSFANAWNAWRKSGKFDVHARGALGGGLVILTLALMFLLNLNWAIYWPLMVIVGGFSMFLGAIPDSEMEKHQNLHHFAGLGVWFGIAAMLLGAAFLFKNLATYEFTRLFGSFRWYGIFLVIPAIGALINAFVLRHENDNRFNMPSRVLFGIGLLMLVVAGFILSPLNWSVLTAVILIALGLIVMLTAWLR